MYSGSPRKLKSKEVVGRVTDLSFLRSFSRKDDALLEKFIRIFLIDAGESMKLLGTAIRIRQWGEVRSIAHSLGSQFNFMGITEGEELLKWMKEHAKIPREENLFAENMSRLNTIYRMALIELREEVKFLKNY